MKKAEFEALLKLQGFQTLPCEVVRGVNTEQEKLYSVDVVNNRYDIITSGEPAKTLTAALQKTMARHFKKYANN